jgi:MFS family permease
MLFFAAGNAFALLAALVVFFSAFNVMEASLPSLITKVAPAAVKGTAMGVYSSLQFLGIFVGGIIGGFAHQHGGSGAVFAVTAALALIWLFAAASMAQPSYVTTRLIPIAENAAADADGLAARLRQVPGVVEAVIVADENLAYLKVDAKSFDAAQAEALAGKA